MRVVIGKGISPKIKSQLIADSEISKTEAVIVDFPIPAKRVKVLIQEDNKKEVLVLLFD